MKTPREILLARHRAAEPRLDAIRRAALAEVCGHRPAAAKPDWAAALASFCLAPWRELILPSRRVWTGLATVWAVMILINLTQRDTSGSAQARYAGSPSVVVSWQIQQRWMNELLADRSTPPDADRPKSITPRPRTEHMGFATA